MREGYKKYVEYVTLKSFNIMIDDSDVNDYFTLEEIKLYSVDKKRRSLAARWLIKKILIKHFNNNLSYKDISITNEKNGKPILKINDIEITDTIFISMSHSRLRASGMVVIDNGQ